MLSVRVRFAVAVADVCCDPISHRLLLPIGGHLAVPLYLNVPLIVPTSIRLLALQFFIWIDGRAVDEPQLRVEEVLHEGLGQLKRLGHRIESVRERLEGVVENSCDPGRNEAEAYLGIADRIQDLPSDGLELFVCAIADEADGLAVDDGPIGIACRCLLVCRDSGRLH